jgi:molybdopterin synthase sulfur carrier subunit
VPTVSLRLFAAARDAAGRSSDTVEAATVGEVLDHARGAYGAHFTEVLAKARVWVNGDEPADGDATPLNDGDEVAVLPPVSGGSGATADDPDRAS